MAKDVHFMKTTDEKLIQAYFDIRGEVFLNDHNDDIYIPGADKWDKHPDTIFIVAIDKDGDTERVVGGRRIIVHRPDSALRLSLEERRGAYLSGIVPHLDLTNISYGEVGGLAFDRSIRGDGLGASTLFGIYRKTLEIAAQADVPLLFIAAVGDRNLARNERFYKRSGTNFAVRSDVCMTESTPDKTHLILVSTQQDLNLLPPNLRGGFISP